MQVVVWIVIILLALLLIWLLRKWIKRLIFILILLILAFFIYGIFNPSGASRLWYNVRTFPQRVTSRISDKKDFLDYDSYKLKLSDVGAKIKGDEDASSIRNSEVNEEESIQKSDEKKGNKTKENVEEKTIQSFSGLTPQFVEVKEQTKKSDSNDAVGYSKTDLIGIIGEYVENNLDDDTDILVTVEYSKDVSNPDKIILETQARVDGTSHSVSKSRSGLKSLFGGLRRSKSETLKVVSGDEEKIEVKETRFEDEADWVIDDNPIVIEGQAEKVETPVVSNTSTTQTTSRGLTQSEIRESEQIFGILF